LLGWGVPVEGGEFTAGVLVEAAPFPPNGEPTSIAADEKDKEA